MRRFFCIVLVVFLLISIYSVSSRSVIKAETTTWVVDDNGPADFSSIQAAVDAATSGDTIQVKAGVYNENVALESNDEWGEKDVNIVGEDRQSILNGGVSISLGSATISNLTISSLINVDWNAHLNIYDNYLLGGITVEMFSGGPSSADIINNTIENVGLQIAGGAFIYNNSFENCGNAIRAGYNINALNNTIINSDCAFDLYRREDGSSFFIDGNIVSDCNFFLKYEVSSNCKVEVKRNTITDCNYGLYLNNNEDPTGLKCFNNNFINVITNVYLPDVIGSTEWNAAYPQGGNFWSNYIGQDLYCGASQNVLGSDGIGDSPYVLDSNNIDYYPLMNPWIESTDDSYLLVRGSNNVIYYRVLKATTGSWSGWVGLSGQTQTPPAAYKIGNELHIVVRGVNNGQIWHGFVDLETDVWSGWTLLDGSTPSPPILTGNNTHLCLVVRGSNNYIYYRFYEVASRQWGDWVKLSSGLTQDTPAVQLVSDGLHVVVKDVYNEQIWHASVDLSSNSLSSWTKLSGTTPSVPTLTGNGTHLCLVVRGSNDQIYYRFYSLESESWSGWVNFASGSTPDTPAATVVGDELHVVVRGMSNDQIWYSCLGLSSQEWTGWNLLDGTTPTKPTLTSFSTSSPAIQNTSFEGGLNYLSESGRFFQEDSITKSDFEFFKSNNVNHVSIRILWKSFIEYDLSETISNYNRLLSVADDCGMKVQLDFWTSFNDSSALRPTNLPSFSDVIRDPTTKQEWLSFVNSTMREFTAHSCIESWTMMNEPYIKQAEDEELFYQCWAEQYDLMKNIDSQANFYTFSIRS